MLRRYSVNFALFSILLDTIAILVAMALAFPIHTGLERLFPEMKSLGDHQIPAFYMVLMPILLIYFNLGFTLYDGRRNVQFYQEILRLITCLSVTTISMAGLFFFAIPDIVHSIFFSIILLTALIMGFWRVLVRIYWRYQYACNKELRRVLIIGAGSIGRQIEQKISNPSFPNFKVIGFLDDDGEKTKRHPDILGTSQDLEKIVNANSVNIVVIALPPDAFDLTGNIVERLRLVPVKVWVVPNAARLARFQSKTENLAGIPVLDIRAPSISESQRLIKRLFDLFFSSLILLVTSPLLILISILIKLDSPGPTFFRQKRIGENMQPFEMIKFRTMVQNAEALSAQVETRDSQGNIIHKHRNDPRVTRVGRILRRFSLDELPQFFNVLVGNMSIVGPRPELPYLVEKYKSWQYVRFTVPQGITGWWQVTGRSDKPLHLNTEDDFYYIRNYSLFLDLKIITRTFNAVLSGAGAF